MIYPKHLSSSGAPNLVRGQLFNVMNSRIKTQTNDNGNPFVLMEERKLGMDFIKEMLCLDLNDDSSLPLRKGRKDISGRKWVPRKSGKKSTVAVGGSEGGEAREETEGAACSQIVKGSFRRYYSVFTLHSRVDAARWPHLHFQKITGCIVASGRKGRSLETGSHFDKCCSGSDELMTVCPQARGVEHRWKRIQRLRRGCFLFTHSGHGSSINDNRDLF